VKRTTADTPLPYGIIRDGACYHVSLTYGPATARRLLIVQSYDGGGAGAAANAIAGSGGSDGDEGAAVVASCKCTMPSRGMFAHNCIMVGPPGSGKTLLARALPGILPRLSPAEALDVTRIYSVSGHLGRERAYARTRPFRAPHHTVSYAGLVGGGHVPRPGEISLAHRGVLFLDELPEFNGQVLEVLRQPLENKVVSISRAAGSLTFPANVMLVAAMNPCPCGYHGDRERACVCSSIQIARYTRKISGPLLDRIDIHLDVPRVPYEKLTDRAAGESSATVRERVEAARDRQRARFMGTALLTNADMGPGEVRRMCTLDVAGEQLMRAAARQMHLSARAHHRVLKLARTISDLAGVDQISAAHLAEALQYRPREAVE